MVLVPYFSSPVTSGLEDWNTCLAARRKKGKRSPCDNHDSSGQCYSLQKWRMNRFRNITAKIITEISEVARKESRCMSTASSLGKQFGKMDLGNSQQGKGGNMNLSNRQGFVYLQQVYSYKPQILTEPQHLGWRLPY